MLDETSVVPLYYQLKEILIEKIKDGSWKEGNSVPSERVLMEEYKVSRATVRKALDELTIEGLIYKKKGLGTFVSKSKVIQNLVGELSFVHQVKKQGLLPSSKVLYCGIEMKLSERIKECLRLNEFQEVFKILRVRYADHEPLILETLYVPQEYSPDLLEEDLEQLAIFQYLEENCNLHLTHSTLEIEPVIISEFEAIQLDTLASSPALLLERILYTKEKAAVYQKRLIRGDRCKFSLNLGSEYVKEGGLLSLKFDKKDIT